MFARAAVLSDAETKKCDHPWVAVLLEALDERLRLRNGVIEYTYRSDCLFRIQLAASIDHYELNDGTRISPGDRLINLHLWNEQVPMFPVGGPTVAWARTVARAFDGSLRELAQYLAARAELDDIAAICGNLAFGASERSAQMTRLVGHFGFEPVPALPERSLRQHVHQLGENILITLMVLARNASALRADTLTRNRTLVLLSRRRLQQRYGLLRGEPV